MEDSDYYFTVNTSENEIRKFTNQTEIGDWQEAIEQLYGFSVTLNMAQGLEQKAQSELNAFFNKEFPSFRATVSSSSISNNRIIASREAEKFFFQRRLVDPVSPFGKALQDLKRTDPSAAFFALSLYHGLKVSFLETVPNSNIPILNTSLAKGASLYALYSVGLMKELQEAKNAFEKITHAEEARLNSVINKGIENFTNLQAQAANAVNAMNTQNGMMEAERSAFSGKMQALDEQWHKTTDRATTSASMIDRTIEESGEKLASLIKSYEAKVQTDSATTYWEDKKRAHKIAAWLIAFGMLGYLVIVYFTFLYFKAHLPPVEFLKLPYWVPFVAALLAIGTIWGARILVRLFFSQVGLHEDATERATMARTYVALIKDSAIKNDHMGIVLEALFRPSGKGLGLDDGSPQLPMEVILKQLINKP